MTVDEVIREALVKATGLIKHEQIAGMLFVVGLIASDHVLNVARGFKC